jgi:hypothetical protein
MLFRGTFGARSRRSSGIRTIPGLGVLMGIRLRLLAAAKVFPQGGSQPFFPVSRFARHTLFPCRKAWVIASAPKIAPQQFCVRMPE